MPNEEYLEDVHVSFVIPCLNEEKTIEDCLNSIINLGIENYELIVVDNGSEDMSIQKAKKKGAKVLSEPNIRVGEVRNKGACQASGHLLAFIDADCLVKKEWVSALNNARLSNDTLVFGGGTNLPDNPTWVEKNWLLESEKGNTLPADLIGCSIVIKKSTFHKIGGFNANLTSGEDSELSDRLKQLGYTIKITKDLNVIHLGNSKTLSDFFKRQFWHGQSYKNLPIKKKIKDPIYILCLIFFISLISSTLTIWFSYTATLCTLSLGLIVTPTILTIKRYTRSKLYPKSLKDLMKSYVLDLTYLSARSKSIIL